MTSSYTKTEKVTDEIDELVDLLLADPNNILYEPMP
jgi:hypothetical protein